MAIIDDGSGNLELTGEHLKNYIKKRFPNSDYVKKIKDKDLKYKPITSVVEELQDKIEELESEIEFLNKKLEYYKLK